MQQRGHQSFIRVEHFHNTLRRDERSFCLGMDCLPIVKVGEGSLDVCDGVHEMDKREQKPERKV